MQPDAWLAFSERVACEDSWHADCLSQEWPPSPQVLERLAESNAAALAAITALETHRVEGADDDHPLMQEVFRLDAKVTALVDIVNRLLAPAGALPSRQLIRFNTIGAVIPTSMLPPLAVSVVLRVRFDACLSLPLEFAAQVQRQITDGKTYLAFVPPSDAQKDAIERLVFRHHRRKVAESRQLTS